MKRCRLKTSCGELRSRPGPRARSGPRSPPASFLRRSARGRRSRGKLTLSCRCARVRAAIQESTFHRARCARRRLPAAFLRGGAAGPASKGNGVKFPGRAAAVRGKAGARGQWPRSLGRSFPGKAAPAASLPRARKPAVPRRRKFFRRRHRTTPGSGAACRTVPSAPFAARRAARCRIGAARRGSSFPRLNGAFCVVAGETRRPAARLPAAQSKMRKENAP